MPGLRQMYLGSQDGVMVLGDHDGRWEQERTILPGERVQSLAVPDDSQLMYAKLVDGIYASSDNGQSWDRVFDRSVYYLHVDPSNPETIFAGMEPVALYKSQDGGDSWAELESLRRQPDSIRDKWWFPSTPYDAHVKHMYIEPLDPNQIYVALEHGGFLRTDDGGETWEDVTDGVEYPDCHIVHSHPTQKNIVFGGTARAFLRSEDYGRDWVQVANGLTRDDVGSFAVMGGTHVSLFIGATEGSPPSWLRPSGAESAIFRSEDDGLSWRQLGGGFPATQPLPLGTLRLDPIDTDRIYVSASHFGQYPGPNGGEVWMSPDRGDTWTRIYEASTRIQLLNVGRSSE